jgi:hypothetical protein
MGDDDDDADEEAQCEAWEKAKLFAQRVQVATKDDGIFRVKHRLQLPSNRSCAQLATDGDL